MSHDIKRYAMIALTVGAFSVAGWQVIDMLSDNSASMSTSTQAKKIRSAATTPLRKHHTTQHHINTAAAQHMAAEPSPYVQLAKAIELAKLKNKLIEQQVAIAEGQEKLRNSNANQNELMDASQETSYHYRLVFSMKQSSGRWQAVLSHAGQRETVHIGSQLMGGYRVAEISTSQVILSHPDHPLRVSFNSESPYHTSSISDKTH